MFWTLLFMGIVAVTAVAGAVWVGVYAVTKMETTHAAWPAEHVEDVEDVDVDGREPKQ
jgi:hypothetical protein